MDAIWSLLPLGIQRDCATQDCERPAAYEMEAGGVGSNYCKPCSEKIKQEASLLKLQRLGQDADATK